VRPIENGTEDRVIDHRNMLVGLWAGARLGVPEESRVVYALEVWADGLKARGPDDLVDKIARDFAERGIPIIRGHILVQLSKMHRFVTAQYVATDREEEVAS